MPQRYDAIFVGTSFASSFFLHAYLAQAPADARVLVLERGPHRPLAWRLQHRAQVRGWGESRGFYRTSNRDKPWVTHVELGGNSNCWWGCTPRMTPADLTMRTSFGVGVDWPVRYEELEPFYAEAERLLQVAGPDDHPAFPRSGPYPLPPHRLSDVDRILADAFPGEFVPQPCARPSVATAKRARCCANGVCEICPIDSKFTVLNELAHLFEDPRVTLLLEAPCTGVDVEGAVARGVRFERDGREEEARGDLVILGANALFNPVLLLRSGLEHRELGRGLNEQVGVNVHVLLDGVDNFQGSTSVTGHGYMLYGGARRRGRARGLLETWNVPLLRLEPGKYRQQLRLRVVFEDLRQPQNRVRLADDGVTPEIIWDGHSDYTQRALEHVEEDLGPVLGALPVESFEMGPVDETEAHILGTTVFGEDPRESVLDRRLVHHRVRNLVVLGGGAFPTSTPANPTLTICALSLWSAAGVLA